MQILLIAGDVRCCAVFWGLINKISYNNLTIMPKLLSTYDGRLIYETP